MRVLILSTEFPPGPGGIGTHAVQLATHLTNEGWQVAVLTPQDYAADDEIVSFNQSQPFEVVRLPSGGSTAQRLLDRTGMAARWMREWKPDVLIGTGARQVWITALMAWLYGKKWMAVGHGTEFGVTSRWQKSLMQWSFNRADLVICVSQFTRQYMLDAGFKPKRTAVIPNGADDTRFRRLSDDELAAFKQKHTLPGQFRLITVGNVTQRKGQDVVIRALPHILKEIPDVHYMIAGLPTQKDNFLAIAEGLGVANNVHFLGRLAVSDLLGYLNTSDLFVMTSRHTAGGDFEGYGIAVIEAALCGLPAVVATGSGLMEAVVDGETGLHATTEDPLAVAQAVVTLLQDQTKRMSMGQAAHHRAAHEHTWSYLVHQYHEHLRDITN